MKKLALIILVTLGFASTACSFLTRDDIKKQEEDKQLREQVTSMQRGRADTDARFGELQDSIRSLGGRVETIEHNQQVGDKGSRQESDNLKKIIDAQNEKIKALENHIDATETRLTAAIQALTDKPSVAAPATESKSTKGVFDDAQTAFEAKDFKKAIVKYESYREKSPKGSHIAEATYKIGVCFSELGMKKDAKEFYQEILEKFPTSSYAKKAKLRLGQGK